MRGDRTVEYLDLASAEWAISPTGSGIARLLLSKDLEGSGAFTQALYSPAGFATDEKSHFADTDHEIFMYEGDWAFDLVHPMKQGDYLYRPAGTVYGDNEHTDDSGTQIISFGRNSVKFHFEDPPKPWIGQYLVDAVWNDRDVQPMFVRSGDLPWVASAFGKGIEEKRIRGVPGEKSATMGSSKASPWAADAAFLIKIPAGYDGEFPVWPGATCELLTLAGQATLGDRTLQRGMYTFGGFCGPVKVTDDLVFYGRCFCNP